MANLLPQEYRKSLGSEYKLRLATGGLGLLAVVLAVAIVLLIPSLILTEARFQQHQTVLESVTAASTSVSTQQNQEIIQSANQKLSVIQSATNNQLEPTDVVSLITDAQPVGIMIRRLTINPTSETNAVVTITGTARTRDGLLAFENNLSTRSQVTAVDLPIETLARRQNAEFSLEVTLQSL